MRPPARRDWAAGGQAKAEAMRGCHIAYPVRVTRSFTLADLEKIAARHCFAIERHKIMDREMPAVVIVYPTGEREVLIGSMVERPVKAYFYALAAEIALKDIPEGEEAELVFHDAEMLDEVLAARDDAMLEHNAWRLTAFPIYTEDNLEA